MMKSTIQILTIVQCCAAEWGIPAEMIIDKDRRQVAVDARFAACLIAKEFTNESNEFIGEHIGSRDESTIHHAIHTGNCWCQIDKKYDGKVRSARIQSRKLCK